MEIGLIVALSGLAITIGGLIWRMSQIVAQVNQNSKDIQLERDRQNEFRKSYREEQNNLIGKIEDIIRTQVRILTILEEKEKKHNN